jgi:hypothetical protein
MDLAFLVATLTRRGMLNPGSPIRVAAQLAALRKWGFSLAGELRQAAARDPDRTAVIDVATPLFHSWGYGVSSSC